MKRFAVISVNLLLISGLITVVNVPVARAASVPKILNTCTSETTGSLRIAGKAACNYQEKLGSWVQLSSSFANSKVIFTCMNNKLGIRLFVQGECDNELESKGAWIRTAASEDINDALCANGGRCVVGDIGPGGGMVFYAVAKMQKWGRYLEAANPNTWQDGGTDPKYTWCQNPVRLVGALGTVIGMGAVNTKKVLAKCSDGAAVAVHEYRGGGMTDWFLPSKDELFQMYLNLNGIFGLFPGSYWSSSEFDGTSVWYRDMSFGAQWHTSKDTAFYVRPIRAF